MLFFFFDTKLQLCVPETYKRNTKQTKIHGTDTATDIHFSFKQKQKSMFKQ